MLFELALDVGCPARRFALHCLYIYAADGIRTNFRAHPKRRLKKLVEQAEARGRRGARHLGAQRAHAAGPAQELFDYHDWCEGGLVRHPRRLGQG